MGVRHRPWCRYHLSVADSPVPKAPYYLDPVGLSSVVLLLLWLLLLLGRLGGPWLLLLGRLHRPWLLGRWLHRPWLLGRRLRGPWLLLLLRRLRSGSPHARRLPLRRLPHPGWLL